MTHLIKDLVNKRKNNKKHKNKKFQSFLEQNVTDIYGLSLVEGINSDLMF